MKKLFFLAILILFCATTNVFAQENMQIQDIEGEPENVIEVEIGMIIADMDFENVAVQKNLILNMIYHLI
ncbi:MAG: hypothetical protein U9Q12_03570 [Patescibacteria group bacterium]|nr:hypothetical protein [Patescibacteria group bacterium]